MYHSQKGFANIILVVIILIFAGAVAYYASIKNPVALAPSPAQTPITSAMPTPTAIVTSPTPALSSETANWKTYRNEQYGFEMKYPTSLQKVNTNNSSYDQFSYCDGTIVKTPGSDVSEVCRGTSYKIGITVYEDKLVPDQLKKYYDVAPVLPDGTSGIKKYQIAGRDFYIGKSSVYTYQGWYTHTALGNKTLAIDFSGNAYVLRPTSDILTREELQKITDILSTLQIR